MVEDEDDDGFGDFKFATFQTHVVDATHASQINALNSTTEDDDDWGDFVNHSSQINIGFEPSKGLSLTQAPPNPLRTSKPSDPFGFQTAGIESVKAQWMRPRGALPLSIFGEEEKDEVESGAGDSTSAGDITTFAANNGNYAEKELNLGAGVGINGIIANFYSQNQHIKAEDMSILNSNARNLDLGFNYLNSKTPLPLDSNPSGSNLNLNGTSPNDDVTTLEFSFNGTANGVNLNPNGLGSDLVEDGQNFGDDDDDDVGDGGWDFKAADSGTLHGNEDSEEQFILEPYVSKLENSTQIDQHIQVNGKAWKNFEGAEHAFGINSGAHNLNDLFVPSTVLSGKIDGWDFGFDVHSNYVPYDGILSDIYSKGKPSDPKIGLCSSPSAFNGNADHDENIWKFSNGFSDIRMHDSLEEPKVIHVPPSVEALPSNSSQSFNLNDSLVSSNMTPPKSGEWDFGLYFSPSPVKEGSTMSDTYRESELNNSEKGSNTYLADVYLDSDVNSWEFKDAFSETGLSENVNNDLALTNHQEAFPLSNFSDIKLEKDDLSISRDISSYTSDIHRNNLQSHGSNKSLNDIVSSLYSQAEQKSPANHKPKDNENGENCSSTMLQPDLVNDDDFDDDSWEFKDALSGIDADDQTFVSKSGDLPTQSSTELQLNELVDFYYKLKDDLCFIALSLLENLKEAQSIAALSGEGTKSKTLYDEIQKFSSDLTQYEALCEDFQPESISPRNACLSELLEVLQEPKFQVLESEYQLSKQLLLAEKDLTSAVELLKHAASMLKILELGSVEEQSFDISLWYRMVYVCSEELKHGAWIWKESLQKNVHDQILSEPQGKKYILALGEIYRVVETIGAATKLYKPWLLLSSVNPSGLFSLLSECRALWSSSGLSEALQIINDPIGLESKSLMSSIYHVQDLDEPALQNHVLSGKQPTCHVSALTAETVPGMKMIVWNGKHYFLKLANLWANLISRDPPTFHDGNAS